MPLLPGKSKEIISKNIEKLLSEYHDSGKIGNTTPKNDIHAKKIASAISYKHAGKSKRKPKKFKKFLESISPDISKELMDTIKIGFSICLESELDVPSDDIDMELAIELANRFAGDSWTPLAVFVGTKGLADEKHKNLTLSQIDTFLTQNDDPLTEEELFSLRDFIMSLPVESEEDDDHEEIN